MFIERRKVVLNVVSRESTVRFIQTRVQKFSNFTAY